MGRSALIRLSGCEVVVRLDPLIEILARHVGIPVRKNSVGIDLPRSDMQLSVNKLVVLSLNPEAVEITDGSRTECFGKHHIRPTRHLVQLEMTLIHLHHNPQGNSLVVP
jgi:hypothetical protein